MKMSYFVFGTNNMDAAMGFYDALFAPNGPKRFAQTERMAYYQGADFTFALALPYDDHPACHGNGTMLGLDAGSIEEVRRLHAQAIALGGTDEGEPCQKGRFFSGYVRDLDRNKICFFVSKA